MKSVRHQTQTGVVLAFLQLLTAARYRILQCVLMLYIFLPSRILTLFGETEGFYIFSQLYIQVSRFIFFVFKVQSTVVDPHRFQRGSGSSIFRSMRIRIKIWIWIQLPGPDPHPGFRWHKFFYFTAEKNQIFYQKLQFIYSLDFTNTSKLQEKPSALKKENAALQNMKFLHFFLVVGGHFLPSCIRIRIFIPNADLQHWLKIKHEKSRIFVADCRTIWCGCRMFPNPISSACLKPSSPFSKVFVVGMPD